MPYDGQMDKECIALCDALNAIPGIQTTSSCCGHGRRPFWIFFYTRSFKALAIVAYWADHCHSGFGGWRVIVNTDCGARSNSFLLEGPVGDYAGARKIADAIDKGEKKNAS